MFSWCGAAVGRAGVDRFLITLLLDDVRVALEAWYETAFDQKLMQLDQRPNGHARRADLHAGAGHRIQHPRRHQGDHAGHRLDIDIVATAALLAVVQTDTTPVERMPAVVDLNFLPDMGRMTGRWRSDGKIGCSPAPMPAVKSWPTP